MNTPTINAMAQAAYRPFVEKAVRTLLLAHLTGGIGLLHASPLQDQQITLDNGVPLYLHALGNYEQHEHLLYMAAIYMPLSAKALDEPNSRRLEMRINSPQLTPARFTQSWLDGILLNSSAAQRNALQRDLDAFGKAFARAFEPGDQLTIDYISVQDRTVFAHNGRQQGSVQGSALFDLLLQTWIGTNPLSAEMKAELLDCVKGQIPTTDVRKYRLLPLESVTANTLKSLLPN